MEEEVRQFINRRFSSDNPDGCNWTAGNCFYFALILSYRFSGIIYYDTVEGHFITEIQGKFYDYKGVYAQEKLTSFIRWDIFDQYDAKQVKRVRRDCIL